VQAFYDVRNFDPHEGLGYLVTRVRRRILDLIEPEVAGLGLTIVQAIVILGVSARSSATAADFCRNLQYDPGAMTRVIDRLEKLGYLKRVRHTRDRRSQRLELTDAGRKILLPVRSALVSALNDMLRGFTRSEAQQLTGFLKRLAGDK
jgi:DNA-binding MarR family transcriptional regulator